MSPYAQNPVWKFACLDSRFSVFLAWDISSHVFAIGVQYKARLNSFILTNEL